MRRPLTLTGVVVSLVAMSASGQSGSEAPTHIALQDRPWTSTEQYPEALRRVYRYRAMIGGQRNVLKQSSQLLEPVPEQPPQAKFESR